MNAARQLRAERSSVLALLAVATVLSTILLGRLPVGNLINLAVTGLLGAAVIFAIVVLRRSVWGSIELFMVLAWLAWSLIPSVFAVDQELALIKAIQMLIVVFLAFSIMQVQVWQGPTRLFLWAYVIAMCASYIVTFTPLQDVIAQSYEGLKTQHNAGGTERVAGTLGIATKFGVAATLAQSLVLVLLAIRRTTTAERVVGFIAFLILSMAVINSGTRTAMVGSVFLLLGSVWVFGLWRPKALLKVVAWAVVAALVGGGLLYTVKDIPEVQERYYQVVEGGKLQNRMMDFVGMLTKDDDEGAVERSGESLRDRMGLALAAWDTANDSPFGVGLDNFGLIAGVYAHSNYMELLATTGFPGLVLYYLAYLMLTIKAFKLWRRVPHMAQPKALLLGIGVLALMDIQNVSYYFKSVWLYLAILIGATEICRRQVVAALQQQQQPVGNDTRNAQPTLNHA
ncbi:O-antigen ligase family protein [Granulosicoccaceae sp. 1_MG-2023]|nr:O-antigen ligase family protein [Granulosicoccaceae sp. 1_MG-2023]